MGNELEEFLKRAAQRRAENVAVRGEQQQRQQQQQRPLQPQAPEYTDRNRERVATLVEDDEEIIVAEVVPAGMAGQAAFSKSGLAERNLSALGASTAVDEVYAPTSSQAPSNFETRAAWNQPGATNSTSSVSASPKPTATTASAAALVKLLKSPEGVRQAFLMREILDRPVDRW